MSSFNSDDFNNESVQDPGSPGRSSARPRSKRPNYFMILTMKSTNNIACRAQPPRMKRTCLLPPKEKAKGKRSIYRLLKLPRRLILRLSRVEKSLLAQHPQPQRQRISEGGNIIMSPNSARAGVTSGKDYEGIVELTVSSQIATGPRRTLVG